jgi:hypothetical protein
MSFGYFYFSKKCAYCEKLMGLMARHNIFQHFKSECIDDIDLLELQKLGIESVPALVLVSYQNGQRKIMIQEKDQAFIWVKQFLQSRRQASINNAESTRKLIQSDNTKNMLKDGLLEYCPDELNGISDNYALCKEDNNMALPKSFVQYDKTNLTEEERILTIPIGNIGAYKKKESLESVYGKDTKKLISQIEDERKRQDNELASVANQKALAVARENLGNY